MKHEGCCFAKHDPLNSLKTSFTASGLHFYIQWLFPQLGGLQVRTLFVLSTCGSEPPDSDQTTLYQTVTPTDSVIPQWHLIIPEGKSMGDFLYH